jgi:hypothetical protein
MSVDAGGIEVVLTAMKNHGTNLDVRREACTVLENLAYIEIYVKPIVDAGDIALTVKAMKNNNNNSKVLAKACAILENCQTMIFTRKLM